MTPLICLPFFCTTDLSPGLIEKKIEYCHELLQITEQLEPGYSRIRGQILGELQTAMVMQSKALFSEGKITKQAAQVSWVPVTKK